MVRWRMEGADRAYRVSANVAGLWGESGHLGSLGLGMPFAPKDQAECVWWGEYHQQGPRRLCLSKRVKYQAVGHKGSPQAQVK